MPLTAAVFGATGLVGNAITEALRRRPEFDNIYSYARRPPMFVGNKTEFKPFETDNFKVSGDIDVIFCALGTTIKKAGSREDFQEVDLHAVKRIAEKAKEAGIKSLLVVSSVGADAASNNFYLRTKGEMEDEVKKAGIKHTVFIRPSLLLGKRQEKRVAEGIGKTLFRPLRLLMVGPLKQYRPVYARKVAQKMTDVALEPHKGVLVIENREIFG